MRAGRDNLLASPGVVVHLRLTHRALGDQTLPTSRASGRLTPSPIPRGWAVPIRTPS